MLIGVGVPLLFQLLHDESSLSLVSEPLLSSFFFFLFFLFFAEFLSLEENPVTLIKGYREYIVTKMTGLRVLDYVKISKAERQLAGGGGSSSSSTAVSSSSLSEEEKAALKVAVTRAKTKEELEVLMKALDEGKLPEGFTL
jgi:hypothetical protein